MSDKYAHLPLRPCVGIALFNRDGLVFVGQRIQSPERMQQYEFTWQMPQGGIDAGEDIVTAATRELYEETGIKNVTVLRVAPHTITYTFADEMIENPYINKRYRGQEQTWVAMRFDGDETEINLNAHHQIEFNTYKWVPLKETIDLIVPFKRAAYEQVYALFKDLGV